MIKIETTAANKQSGVATASLDRLTVEIAPAFSLLNIFRVSFLALANDVWLAFHYYRLP